jgi:phosphoribosylformylglycinamidine cyclo-ligase
MTVEKRDAYAAAGVDYQPLDRFKRLCQTVAATTAGSLSGRGLSEPEGIRGESAYLIEAADCYWAHVEEGLGTKNLIADAMLRETGYRGYRAIGIDTVATIVNDLLTCGALPLVVAMHAAVGDEAWFEAAHRGEDLAHGFAEGCRLAGAVWGGGETPVLKGIVEPATAVLAGSAIGRIDPKEQRIVGDIRDGDAIVMLASSGVQTNGMTLCRSIAAKLPDGYRTKISDGRPFGEALLAPSVIYASFVRACQEQKVRLHYAAHVTGHGWRKLMRPREAFVYRITQPPPVPAIFEFLMRAGGLSLEDAYSIFNMGAGFAVYLDPGDAERCVALAKQNGIEAWIAGHIEKQGEQKAVEIVPHNVRFGGESLDVRA